MKEVDSDLFVFQNQLAEEIASHLTTKNKLSNIENSYASLIDAMEKEKNCHKETLDKLAVEESNHMITQTECKESKDKLVEEITKQEELVKKLDNEQANMKHLQQSFDMVQEENSLSKVYTYIILRVYFLI